MKFSLGSAKYYGDDHKQNAWRDRGRGQIFDGLGQKFSANTIRYVTATEIALIKKFMPRGRTLDLGCGTGRLLVPLIGSEDHEMYGLDISFSMLEAMIQNVQIANVSPMVVNASASTNLPFGDRLFDGVLSFGVISHYKDWRSVIRRVVPHLKIGAPLIFDLSVEHQERDGFAAATNPSLGGFRLDEVAGLLGEVGLQLDRVMPWRFGGSMDATAGWLDPRYMTVETFGQLHILIERYVERLLGDPACYKFALKLDVLLRDLLAFSSEPIFRPAAPVIIIARRADSSVNTQSLSPNLNWHIKTSVADALNQALGGEEFCGARKCDAFMRYLAFLDPLLRKIDGGCCVVEQTFGDAYVVQLEPVQHKIRRMIDGKFERALRANAFKYYRRLYRRWLSLR